jgi:hypothetical protein
MEWCIRRRMDVRRRESTQQDWRGRIADIPILKTPVSLYDQNVAPLDIDVLGIVGERRVRVPVNHAHVPWVSDIDDAPPIATVPAISKSSSRSVEDAKLIGLIPVPGVWPVAGTGGKTHVVITEDLDTRYVPIARLDGWETAIMESPARTGQTSTDNTQASSLQKCSSIHSHTYLLVK